MKLCSDIKPRADGTLVVHGRNPEKIYTFTGMPLSAEVDDEDDVSFFLNSGSFYPENPEDFERAGQTLGAALIANPNGDDDQDEDEDEDENDDEELVNGGPPLEALTPAKPKATPAKPKAKAK